MPDLYPEGEFLLPLFPLPNLVFFPNTRLPLHVFEPRYRALVADALATDNRIGMVLLRPGWERDYYGSPAIHEYGTLGIIEQSVALEEGRYNILLNGVVRFRIHEEKREAPYRVARVTAEPELPAEPTAAWAQRAWLSDLSSQYLHQLQTKATVPEIASATLESLTNALIMSLDLALDVKQELLEQKELIARAHRVGELLEERISALEFLSPYRSDSDPALN